MAGCGEVFECCLEKSGVVELLVPLVRQGRDGKGRRGVDYGDEEMGKGKGESEGWEGFSGMIRMTMVMTSNRGFARLSEGIIGGVPTLQRPFSPFFFLLVF